MKKVTSLYKRRKIVTIRVVLRCTHSTCSMDTEVQRLALSILNNCLMNVVQIRYCKDIKNNVYKNTHNKIPMNIEKTVAMETCVLSAELHPSASHSQYSILILQVPVLFKQPSSESTAIAHCRIILSSLSTANIKISAVYNT